MSYFHPDSIFGNDYIPPVALTGISLAGGIPVPTSEWRNKGHELELSYEQKVVNFQFVALNYISPQQNEYAYQLEGLDEGWNIATNKRNVQTHHIPVILLTARTTPQQHKEGIEHGADVYLQKPFHADLLIKQVRNLIATHRNFRNQFARELLLQSKEPEQGTTDERFLKRAAQVISLNLAQTDFTLRDFEQEVGGGKTAVTKQLKELTGMTFTEFVRDMRLKQSLQLLDKSDKTISEIAYEAGFNDPKYFSRVFKAEYGISPTEWRKQKE